MKNPMKDPISEGLLVKSWSNYLRAWISLKGPTIKKSDEKKNPIRIERRVRLYKGFDY